MITDLRGSFNSLNFNPYDDEGVRGYDSVVMGETATIGKGTKEYRLHSIMVFAKLKNVERKYLLALFSPTRKNRPSTKTYSTKTIR